jgi:hypothetical protein
MPKPCLFGKNVSKPPDELYHLVKPFSKLPQGRNRKIYFYTLDCPGESMKIAFPDPPSAEFAGDSRRWVSRRTPVLQVPTNDEDSVKSADPKGQKNEAKNSLVTTSVK